MKQQTLWIRCGFIVLLSLGNGALVTLRAQQFEVEGRLTYSVYVSGKLMGTVPKNFTVQVSGCESLYRSEMPDTKGSIQVATDGNGLFRVDNIPTDGGASSTRHGGFVENRRFPRDDGSNINYLWLAYGSACYFDDITDNMADPIWMLDDPKREGDRAKVKALWQRDNGERLLRQISYFGDGFWHTRDVSGASLVIKMPPPFDQGFTNATYQVIRFTNFLGNFIPTEFVFTRYGVHPSRKGHADIAKVSETHAEVTLVKALPSSFTLMPHLNGSTLIIDMRFKNTSSNIMEMGYIITNGNWKTTNELIAQYKAELRTLKVMEVLEKEKGKSTKRRSTVVTIVLVIILLLPAGFLLRRRLNR